jgi:hypothetical protein
MIQKLITLQTGGFHLFVEQRYQGFPHCNQYLAHHMDPVGIGSSKIHSRREKGNKRIFSVLFGMSRPQALALDAEIATLRV